MSGVAAILEQIQPLVTQLNAEERLTLIHSIAQLEPFEKPTGAFVETSDDAQQQMLIEQEVWFKQPVYERAKYRGRYIAIRHGAVIDQDVDRRALLRRVRTQFGDAPIPVISGDEDLVPEYVVYSPQIMH